MYQLGACRERCDCRTVTGVFASLPVVFSSKSPKDSCEVVVSGAPSNSSSVG